MKMNVTWTLPAGGTVSAAVEPGQNLMEAATENNVENVTGECGGSLSCATCHVYVEGDWFDKTGEIGEFEDAMLDMAPGERRPNSRLSCQIEAHPDLDGLQLTVPES
jgi:2Fe-2S ferredoxin